MAGLKGDRAVSRLRDSVFPAAILIGNHLDQCTLPVRRHANLRIRRWRGSWLYLTHMYSAAVDIRRGQSDLVHMSRKTKPRNGIRRTPRMVIATEVKRFDHSYQMTISVKKSQYTSSRMTVKTCGPGTHLREAVAACCHQSFETSAVSDWKV